MLSKITLARDANTLTTIGNILRIDSDPKTRFGFDSESSGPLLVDKKKNSEFVNMYRATLTGCSFYFPEHGAFYVPINHTEGNAPPRAVSALLEDFKRTKAVAVAHNVKHELLAFKDRVDLHDVKLADSMLVHWLLNKWANADEDSMYGLKALSKTFLGYEMLDYQAVTRGKSFSELDPSAEETLRYACEDAWGAYELYTQSYEEMAQYKGMTDTFWDLEMPFTRVLRHIEDTGMEIDREALVKLREDAQAAVGPALKEWEFVTNGLKINSSKDLQELYKQGHWSTEGVEQKKKSGMYSTEKEYIEGQLTTTKPLSIGRVAAELRLTYMEYAKLISTYTDSLIRNADQYPDGRLHSSFNHCGAATGRLSSSYPNLTNVPTRTDLGKRVLDAFVSFQRGGTEWELSNADYSQIELRVLAHLCGAGPFFDAYVSGEDVHQRTADDVGVDRFQGKTLNFAVVYGAGDDKLGRMLGMSSRRAGQVSKRMFDTNKPLVKLREDIVAAARARGYVRTLAGRIRRLDNIDSSRFGARLRDERRAFNTPIQGGARDVMTRAMVNIYSRLRRENLLDSIQMCNQVHDDNLLYNTLEAGPYAREILKHEMESAARLRVPLVVEPGHGKTWKALK